MASHVQAYAQLGKLPRVGQTVKSKKYGTLWRIVGKAEVWQNLAENDPKTNEPRMVPGIQLTFWRVKEGVLPGVGKMMGFIYTAFDNTFDTNWDVVE